MTNQTAKPTHTHESIRTPICSSLKWTEMIVTFEISEIFRVSQLVFEKIKTYPNNKLI